MRSLYIVILSIIINVVSAKEIYRVNFINYDDSLSIRTGPSVRNKKIASIPYNTNQVSVIKCRKFNAYRRWCKISYFNHKTHKKIVGWVNAKYLFPITSDRILQKRYVQIIAKKTIMNILKYILHNEPCQLNKFIHPKFGLISFIVPSGIHTRIYRMNNICDLDSKKNTEGVYGLTAPVMGDWNRSMPSEIIYGKVPSYSYDYESWIIDGYKPKAGRCYVNTLDGDDDSDGIFLDAPLVDMLTDSKWSREDYSLVNTLKYLKRYSYKVVIPDWNLVFYITYIDGKFYLTAFDFASMNRI